MGKDFETVLKEFRDLIQKIKHYNDSLAILYWDLRTGAPRKGVPQRAEVLGTLSTEVFKMSTSDKMAECLEYLEKPENNAKLDNIMKVSVIECRKEYDKSKKIPEDMYKEYVILTSEAESVWEDAKLKNDFEMFKPYLEKIVEFNRKFIELWGYKGNKYNTLLDFYEPGMTVEKLDKIFGDLRSRIVPLVQKIKESGYQPDDKVLNVHYDIDKQKEFCIYLLKEMGYDFDAGRLDISEHPFTMGVTPGDVRITTHYYTNNFISAIMSSLHEGGHGLYEQGISEDLNGTPLCTGTSMGIHESQSRFWENMIGRSMDFWKCYYEELRKVFPEQLKNVPVEEFYKAVNKSEPSLIRIEADELTYNLHIMVRYEIEKALINNEVNVADLPKVWNEKMKDYLGVVPETNAAGVLQDVHWAGGSFGYFPSYTLGNIYAAQFYNTVRKEFPNFDEMICKGEMLKIREWLKEKIHKYGKLLTPNEIVKAVTGEEINSGYLIEYLEDKFGSIYNVK